ncbi:hypothetical protein RRG08_013614 [Elysia crispata]|uniref:Uncharacterized protein n=1 Tax=Elysia crispata TaxID=231223 RepID=A0AAE1E301_9GAST|nr:hypothetical protein RRG08_013614 [Elysia crispata]
MPRIHALENNEKAKTAAATAPNTPCTQHKAKECHKPDSISVSRTAPSTPSHRRYVSDRAKYQRGGAGGGSCRWQSSDSRSFTTSPRRQAASEAILDSSSPARTAAFAAAATALAPSVVSSIRRKCESERALSPDYALLAGMSPERLGERVRDGYDLTGIPRLTQLYQEPEGNTRNPLLAPPTSRSNKTSLAVPSCGFEPAEFHPRSGPVTSGSRGVGLSGRSASFGDGVQIGSHYDALREDLGVGGEVRDDVLHDPRNIGMGVRRTGGMEQRTKDLLWKGGLGLWGQNTCSSCGGLHFVSFNSSPFLSSGGSGGGPGTVASSSRHHLTDPWHTGRSQYLTTRAAIDAERDLPVNILRQRAVQEFPNGYASETDVKFRQAAVMNLEKEMQSCPLCVSQALASRNGRRIYENVLLGENQEQASRRASTARTLGLELSGPGPPRAGSLKTPAGSPNVSVPTSTSCRVCDEHPGPVTTTPIRTSGWAIRNNPRRVLCYEGLHSNCWSFAAQAAETLNRAPIGNPNNLEVSGSFALKPLPRDLDSIFLPRFSPNKDRSARGGFLLSGVDGR